VDNLLHDTVAVEHADCVLPVVESWLVRGLAIGRRLVQKPVHLIFKMGNTFFQAGLRHRCALSKKDEMNQS
jgi:hypothetical protein